MWRGTLVLLIWAGAVAAQDWRKLDSSEIAAALTSRHIQYENAQQDFFASGKTLYDAGKPSWGYWRVQGDQFCSQWPPNGDWSCYDLFKSSDGQKLRFIGFGGDVSEGTYTNRN
ncbi:MAG: hypothetical protein GY952_18230 [Rhodobacteraceae bacterium]|nr:hypothetical protein [Paracoccaceae bacterium]